MENESLWMYERKSLIWNSIGLVFAHAQSSGYMAPEYAMEGQFSAKSDVFSFGVILLEIISGKKNSGFHLTKRASSLLKYVKFFLLAYLPHDFNWIEQEFWNHLDDISQ